MSEPYDNAYVRALQEKIVQLRKAEKTLSLRAEGRLAQIDRLETYLEMANEKAVVFRGHVRKRGHIIQNLQRALQSYRKSHHIAEENKRLQAENEQLIKRCLAAEARVEELKSNLDASLAGRAELIGSEKMLRERVVELEVDNDQLRHITITQDGAALSFTSDLPMAAHRIKAGHIEVRTGGAEDGDEDGYRITDAKIDEARQYVSDIKCVCEECPGVMVELLNKLGIKPCLPGGGRVIGDEDG